MESFQDCYQGQSADPQDLLIQDRALQSWTAAVPKHNSLVIAGDMNSVLKQHHPNVGPGLAAHKTSAHKDQSALQGFIQSNGLIAVHTWKRAGRPSATFVNHKNHVATGAD